MVNVVIVVNNSFFILKMIKFVVNNPMIKTIRIVYIGENAHIDHPIALQTDHPKLLFFQRV